VRLAGWIREQNATSPNPPFISQETSRRIARMPMPRLRERANRALAVIATKYPSLDQPTGFERLSEDLELQATTYSGNSRDAMVLTRILLEDGHLHGLRNMTTNRVADGFLTPKGLLAAEALGTSMSNSSQGFVAMSFDAALRGAWVDGFDPAIRSAGYQPMRIDAKEYVGGITDEIMAETRKSRFVVADYTGQKNGVYFEAGFALGLGLTIIPTCRTDEVGNLHFDIRHLNYARLEHSCGPGGSACQANSGSHR
jgi:hypothetical protein